MNRYRGPRCTNCPSQWDLRCIGTDEPGNCFGVDPRWPDYDPRKVEDVIAKTRERGMVDIHITTAAPK
jgi:hypothetical protein